MEPIGEDEEPKSQLPRRGLQAKGLSEVSKHYDIGGKGFLTPHEQKARELDADGEGRLPNEEVVALIERTDNLQAANKTLKRWMMGLLVVTVALGCTQIATAIAAARLSKDTSVNSSTGVMHIKGNSETPVVVVSTGRAHILTLDQSSNSVCLSVAELSAMWSATAQGSPTNAVVRVPSTNDGDEEKGNEMFTVTFSAPFSNSTHACMKDTAGRTHCTSFEPCETDGDEPGRRLAQKNHRREFHAHVERHLYDLGDYLPVDPGGSSGIRYGDETMCMNC